jgi:predicted nucleic-acid-binding protein
MSIELKKISYSAMAEYMKQMASFIPTIVAYKNKVKQEYGRLTNLK